jgi:hypothetical protein
MEPFAIVSFVCSLLVGCGVGSIIAIVFGHIARQRIRRDGSDGAGLALAGLIIGYIGVAFTLLANRGDRRDQCLRRERRPPRSQ